MKKKTREERAVIMLALGCALLAAGGLAFFLGILFSIDEPSMGKPWLIAGLLGGVTGLALFIAGLGSLIGSALEARRRR